MDSVGALVPFVLIVVAFYMLIIRPARTRQRNQQNLVAQLGVGARVMTTSGLYAVVEAVEDDGVLLEVAPGVTMRWTKAAVARILPEPDAEDDASDEPDGEDEVPREKPVTLIKPEADPADTGSDVDSAERPT